MPERGSVSFNYGRAARVLTKCKRNAPRILERGVRHNPTPDF